MAQTVQTTAADNPNLPNHFLHPIHIRTTSRKTFATTGHRTAPHAAPLKYQECSIFRWAPSCSVDAFKLHEQKCPFQCHSLQRTVPFRPGFLAQHSTVP